MDKIFRYFTDAINMLQGVYIFVIFVLKRTVMTDIAKQIGLNQGRGSQPKSVVLSKLSKNRDASRFTHSTVVEAPQN